MLREARVETRVTLRRILVLRARATSRRASRRPRADHSPVPLLALEGVSVAFGHLPLIDARRCRSTAASASASSAATAPARPRCCASPAASSRPTPARGGCSPACASRRLEQDVPLSTTAPVFDVVAEGLGEVSALVTAYHHAAVEVERDHSPRALDRLAEAQHHSTSRTAGTLSTGSRPSWRA